jgi:hypothetical protein
VLARTLDAGTAEAEAVLRRLAAAGVDMDDVGLTLEQEAVANFHKSFEEVLAALDTKARQLTAWQAGLLPSGGARAAQRHERYMSATGHPGNRASQCDTGNLTPAAPTRPADRQRRASSRTNSPRYRTFRRCRGQ